MASIISVQGLSKKYMLSHQRRERYTALRDVLAGGVRRLGSRIISSFDGGSHDASHPTHEEFWALKDVHFDVQQGDRVGIIGRNGAGKSTLLKVLSRITEPSAGRVTLRGRVVSLLEIGTGFHPELTGRENIYLNGAILGMSKAEINRKFDEIVDFAEVEKFLDTAVKHYSSGMYVRLAFSVAAHLEPEILIVDEVLSVGDSLFQKKCLGKMQSVGEEGRTVLFVSHNMEAISSLCTKGLMLKQGEVGYEGSALEAVAQYNKMMSGNRYSLEECLQRGGSGGARITAVVMCDEQLNPISQVVSNQEALLYLAAKLDPGMQKGKVLSIGFAIDSEDGKRLFTSVSTWTRHKIVSNGETIGVLCRMACVPFVPGRYLISASVAYQGDTLDSIVHCADFYVTDSIEDQYVNRTKDQGDINISCVYERVDGDVADGGLAGYGQ